MRSLRVTWLYAAAWCVLAAIYCVAFVTNGLPVGLALRNAAASLLPDALLGLLVLRLPGLVRWPQGTKGRFFAAHVGLIAAFSVAAGLGWVGLIALDGLLFTGRPDATINFRIVPFRIVIDALVYCTLAGMAYAARNAEAGARAEALRARAALEALRSQLNPHFILNTFHALVGLVRREPALAESALERLGDLLRYSLRIHRDGIDEVPLREECAFVDSYLALERLRLADRLQVDVDTPAATLEYLVPTFSVQILVENAIRHAIAPRAAGGRLQIRAQQDGGRLRLAVTDNAVSDERATELADPPNGGSGMGLRLLQERLTALYGGRATLTLRRTDGGTCAELELPARRVAEEVDA